MLLPVHTAHRGLKSPNSSMSDLPESVQSATSVESGTSKGMLIVESSNLITLSLLHVFTVLHLYLGIQRLQEKEMC